MIKKILLILMSSLFIMNINAVNAEEYLTDITVKPIPPSNMNNIDYYVPEYLPENIISLDIKVLLLDKNQYNPLMDKYDLPQMESYYYSNENNLDLENSIKDYKKSIISSVRLNVENNQSFDFSFKTLLIGNISNEFSINATPTFLFKDKIVLENLNLSTFNATDIERFPSEVLNDYEDSEIKEYKYNYNYDIYFETITFNIDKNNTFIFRKEKDTYLIVSIKPSIEDIK